MGYGAEGEYTPDTPASDGGGFWRNRNRTPPPPSDLDLFKQRIGELAPRFTDVSDRMFRIGTGEDPLFTDLQGGMFDVLRAQEAEQVRGQEEMFSRRGALNTGASMDSLASLRGGFAGNRANLASQLAMQRL